MFQASVLSLVLLLLTSINQTTQNVVADSSWELIKWPVNSPNACPGTPHPTPAMTIPALTLQAPRYVPVCFIHYDSCGRAPCLRWLGHHNHVALDANGTSSQFLVEKGNLTYLSATESIEGYDRAVLVDSTSRYAPVPETPVALVSCAHGQHVSLKIAIASQRMA